MIVEQVAKELSPSESVIEIVAANEGVDPTELTVPLFEAIDPDALDTLVGSPSQPPLQIEFTYYGYEVAIASDGSVHVSRDG